MYSREIRDVFLKGSQLEYFSMSSYLVTFIVSHKGIKVSILQGSLGRKINLSALSHCVI